MADALKRLTAADARNVAAERDLIDALGRAAAAEQRAKELHRQLHQVEVFVVDTNQTEKRNDEPAPKRLKIMQDASSKSQAQASKAQVRIKQEKAEVAEDLEVSN